GSASIEKQFVITVTDVNEAPSDIALSSSSIPENSGADAVIGAFSTTDPDAGDTFTYTLVAGTGSTDNTAFNISGYSLRANASFNFEAKNSYSVRIRTTDAGALTFEKQFTIAINDINDAPVDGNESTNAVGNTLLEY